MFFIDDFLLSPSSLGRRFHQVLRRAFHHADSGWFCEDSCDLRIHVDGQSLLLDNFQIPTINPLFNPFWKWLADHCVDHINKILPRHLMYLLLGRKGHEDLKTRRGKLEDVVYGQALEHRYIKVSDGLWLYHFFLPTSQISQVPDYQSFDIGEIRMALRG